MIGTIILIAVVAAVAFWLIGGYNALIRLRVRVDEAWSDIDVQLKRRHDLIPNLIETVKGYAKHESGVFQKVTEARANAINAKDPKASAEAENALSGTLKSLFAIAENYPDLKANQNFLDLQQKLAEVEEHVQASRRFYNGNVRDYNTKIAVFPMNIIASMFKFIKREFFEIADQAEKEVPKVDFNN